MVSILNSLQDSQTIDEALHLEGALRVGAIRVTWSRGQLSIIDGTGKTYDMTLPGWQVQISQARDHIGRWW